MKILVTGSSGMVGTHLLYELATLGYDGVQFDRKLGRELHEIGAWGFGEKPDLIVHLAATCSTTGGLNHPDHAFADNTAGTFHVVEYARKNHIPVIYTSSIKAVPYNGQRTPYGLTKYMGELLVEEWNKTYGIDYIINRPGTIYGPLQDASSESGWLGWFIKAAVENKKITVYGTGEQVRDVLFVEDYVQLLIDQIENFDKYKNQTFEVGGGIENAISLNKALDFLGVKKIDHAPARIGDAERYVSTNQTVHKINRWTPRTPWKVGVGRTVEYFRKKAE